MSVIDSIFWGNTMLFVNGVRRMLIVQLPKKKCSQEMFSLTEYKGGKSNADDCCGHSRTIPRTCVGNFYTLVIGGYFIRWIEVFPIPNQEATTIAMSWLMKYFIDSSFQNNCTLIKASI